MSEIRQLLDDYNNFKGTAKERTEKFQERIDTVWNKNLQQVIIKANCSIRVISSMQIDQSQTRGK